LKLKKALEKRGDLSTGLLERFKEIEYPISKLKLYLERSGRRLNSQDAHIFLYFVRGKLEELKEIAEQFDKQYAEDAGSHGADAAA